MLNGKICKTCGKIFFRTWQKPFRFRKQKFCCRKCGALYATSFTKGKPAYNRNKVISVCIQCGKEKEVPISLSNRPFCDRQCMSKWMSKNKCKENHWNWQGGITEDKCRDVIYEGYKDWRRQVFRRDNFTCQNCGLKKSGFIQAHHKIKIKDRPDLVLDVDNGITLCINCHKGVHYGNKL